MCRRHLTRGELPVVLEEAATLAEARKCIAQERPDCVLLDHGLPDGTGVELIRELVAVYGQHAMGLVMLTATGDTRTAVEAIQQGAHDFLQKDGLDPIRLRHAVRSAIEKVTIRREIERHRADLARQHEELERQYARLAQEVEERRRAEAAVRERERQLQIVTDHASSSLLRLDRNLRVRFANLTYARHLQREPSDLLGRPLAEIIGPAVLEQVRPQITAALEGHEKTLDLERAYPDGSRRWIHARFVPEVDVDGAVVGVVIVGTDLSVHRAQSLELARARDEALAASRAKDEFLATLSHELRTPLNPVLLTATEMAANPALPPDVRAAFEMIERNVAMQVRLVDDMLDLTRITRGKLALEMIDLDARQAVTDAVTTIRGAATSKRIALTLAPCDQPQPVRADPVRLQQVLLNVLTNAVKFTPMDGRIDVRVDRAPDGQHVLIEVRDTGLGLTPAELRAIFGEFSQGEHARGGASRRYGGLGLGLAISRRLMEHQGGRISAQSEGRDRGAAFHIELPLRPTTPDPVAPSEPISRRRSAGQRLDGAKARPARILVVDDHPPTRHALAQMLLRRGYDVRTAGSAREALEQANGSDLHLLISDIGLPDTDGYSLLRELRRRQPDVTGIALSGYGMEDDIARSRAAGYMEHLTKPVSAHVLQQAVERLVVNG